MEKLISPNEVKRDVAPCVCARAQRQRGASTEGDEAKRNGGGRRERKRKKEGGGVSREWIRRDGHVENGVYKTGRKDRTGEGGDGVANAGKEGEVHVLERETRYTLDGDEAPFIRERIEGEEGRWEGRTRGRIWRTKFGEGGGDDGTERRARWGWVCACVEDFPLSSLLPPSSSAFFLEISCPLDRSRVRTKIIRGISMIFGRFILRCCSRRMKFEGRRRNLLIIKI